MILFCIGSIPKELGNLTLLIKLDLHKNSLSGENGIVPQYTSDDSNAPYLSERTYRCMNGSMQLYVVPYGIYECILYGLHRIPKHNIAYLFTHMLGFIPVELGNLTTLNHLDLSTNSLSGDMDISFFNFLLTIYIFFDVQFSPFKYLFLGCPSSLLNLSAAKIELQKNRLENVFDKIIDCGSVKVNS